MKPQIAKKFKFVHQNAQMATNKGDELSLLCEEANPDVLVITEHGYNYSNIDFFQIPNYQLANFYCRTSTKGGGVAIFVKNNLEFTPHTIGEPTDKHLETTGIKIQTKNQDIEVIGTYRSPTGSYDSFFSKFEMILNEVTKRDRSFVVMGDFNIDILDVGNPVTRSFADLLGTFGLNWSINAPTRVTHLSETAIDNVISNMTDIEVSVINTAISDHYGQQAIINGHEPTRDPPNKKTIRDTRPPNVTLLNSLLAKESWSFLNFGDPVEKEFHNFEQTFKFYLDVTCPLKKILQKPKKQKCTWITKGIQTSRERLLFLSEIRKNTSNEEFKTFFQNYKRIYRKVIKAAKAYDVSKALLTSKNLSKTSWAIINNKCTKKDKGIELQIGNEQVSDPFKIAEEFNRFFSSVGADQGLCSRQCQPLSSGFPSPMASMALAPVTKEEIMQVIKDFQPKKSNDLNYVSVWLLKQCSKHLLRPLEHLINHSLQSGSFPTPLKKAKIIPIFKKGDPLSKQNYRPISILPVFSKVYEKVFLTRMVNFLDKHNLLSINQFGFRSRKSTTDAVVRLVDIVVEAIESRRHTLSIFIDLSKAFDCVDHDTLTQKLSNYGIRGVPLKWIQSYLKGRSHFVGISDVTSEERGLNVGVPQGSILSPLLFLIYVNDAGSSVQQGRLVQYADDTTLCLNSNSSEELERLTFVELNSLIQHFNDLNLKTNATKTSYIQFCLRQTDSDHSLTVMLDETEIEKVYSAKFLGIHLDQGLTWDCHVDSICSKVSSGTYVLRQLSKYCPVQILMTAYYGVIYPHLSYGLALWGGCTNSNLSRLFILQKKAVRIIAKLHWRESCRPAFKSLNLLTLPCLYILETCIYFKSKCNFIRGSDFHSYETRGRENYRTGRHRTVVYERLPSQAGARFVNKLPNSIKDAPTLKAFKTRLKATLISEAFYSTDEFWAHEWETRPNYWLTDLGAGVD